MRIPGSGTEDDIEKKHYLTNLYAQRVFGLPTIPFENKTENAYYYLYGKRYSTKGNNCCFMFVSKSECNTVDRTNQVVYTN